MVDYIDEYSSLITSDKWIETEQDHKSLEALYKDRWASIKRFPYKSFEEINQWQFTELRELVAYAFNHVQLYREKYSDVGFEPGDLKTWTDFSNLPILYKEEIIESFPDRMVSNEYDLSRTTRSSGSSGKFVTLAVSSEAIYLDTIQGARQVLFQGSDNYKETDVTLFIYTCPWWVSSVNGKYPWKFISTETPIKDAIKIIKDIKPTVLSTYPTYLKQFFEKKINLSDLGIKLVIINSEQSSRIERRELSDFFGIPVRDEFSSEELTRIALECPYMQYHLEEDACYSEIVDFVTKKPIPNGQQGYLIGTNLLNKATPVIRYYQGDTACIEGCVPCKCGSNFRVMRPIIGRYMDSIVGHHGEIIPAGSVMDQAYSWFLKWQIPIHGLKYQIVQEENKDVSVYLVSSVYPLTNVHCDLIKKSLEEFLPKGIGVNIVLSDKVAFDGHKKYRPVISLAKKS
jgi:phenylacetate-CoA ligase